MILPTRQSSRLDLFRMFLHEKREPLPFYRRLAEEAVAVIPDSLTDARVLDLGCGPGHYTRALRDAGAIVTPVDLDREEFYLAGGPPGDQLVGSGMALPFRTAAFDGVLCSNMIEHTPDPEKVIAEIERVVHPGGFVWLSWTNWYSPWGGHDMSPWHYLGPRLGLAVYRRLHGEPKNVPLRSLFPIHIGPMLRLLDRWPGLEVIDAVPRYYPSQRWILQVPVGREVATWNCLVLLRRVA